MIQYQRGQKIVLKLEHMVPGGVAFSRLPDGRPVFVKGGAPGEEACVALTRIKREFAEAQYLETIASSAARTIPEFPAAALSGADWSYLTYAAQLTAKQSILAELLTTIGHLDHPTIQPIVAADTIWRYRNKVEFTFGIEEGVVDLGFHAPRRFDAIIPTLDSALFSEVGRTITNAIRDWARIEGISVYDPRQKTGLLRNLVLRRGHYTDDLLVNLVTSLGEIPQDSLIQAMKGLPISGLVWSQNTSAATIVRIDASHVLAGRSTIEEKFLGETIVYQMDSFFQTNTVMAEKLATVLLDRLRSHKPTRVIDGYAGVGGFGLFAAKEGLPVVSIESHAPSSADAVRNAERLGVAKTIEFVNLEMERYVTAHPLPAHAVLILDPPRAGLHPKALAAIKTAGLATIYYVSCNPATLARDLAALASHYQPTYIQPFDLFPQTSHMETLVELTSQRGD